MLNAEDSSAEAVVAVLSLGDFVFSVSFEVAVKSILASVVVRKSLKNLAAHRAWLLVSLAGVASSFAPRSDSCFGRQTETFDFVVDIFDWYMLRRRPWDVTRRPGSVEGHIRSYEGSEDCMPKLLRHN